MAISFAAIYNTAYSSAFLATHNGAAGDTANLANATILANTTANTPIAAAAAATFADQAAARAACGLDAGAANVQTMKINVIPRSAGATTGWAVDADVAANLLILTATAIGASTCVIILTRRHSVGR